MLDDMQKLATSYRFGPEPNGRTLGIWVGLVALISLIPSIPLLFLPQRPADMEQLVLVSPSQGWEVHVNDASGKPLTCEKKPDPVSDNEYDCDGTDVRTQYAEDTADHAQALRRLTHAITGVPVSGGALVQDVGGATVLVDKGNRAVAVRGTTDNEDFEGTAAYTVVQGANAADLGREVIASFTGDPLPANVNAALDELKNAPSPSKNQPANKPLEHL